MEQKMIELIRFGLFKDRTIGRLTYNDEHFYTIERPWLDNKQNVSCIPAGYYKLGRVDSPRFGPDTWEIKGVPGRTHILIHVANTAHDVFGCLGLAMGLLPQLQGVSVSKTAIENFYLMTKGLDEEEILIRRGILT
jgi:hypothetical protein